MNSIDGSSAGFLVNRVMIIVVATPAAIPMTAVKTVKKKIETKISS